VPSRGEWKNFPPNPAHQPANSEDPHIQILDRFCAPKIRRLDGQKISLPPTRFRRHAPLLSLGSTTTAGSSRAGGGSGFQADKEFTCLAHDRAACSGPKKQPDGPEKKRFLIL